MKILDFVAGKNRSLSPQEHLDATFKRRLAKNPAELGRLLNVTISAPDGERRPRTPREVMTELVGKDEMLTGRYSRLYDPALAEMLNSCRAAAFGPLQNKLRALVTESVVEKNFQWSHYGDMGREELSGAALIGALQRSLPEYKDVWGVIGADKLHEFIYGIVKEAASQCVISMPPDGMNSRQFLECTFSANPTSRVVAIVGEMSKRTTDPQVLLQLEGALLYRTAEIDREISRMRSELAPKPITTDELESLLKNTPDIARFLKPTQTEASDFLGEHETLLSVIRERVVKSIDWRQTDLIDGFLAVEPQELAETLAKLVSQMRPARTQAQFRVIPLTPDQKLEYSSLFYGGQVQEAHQYLQSIIAAHDGFAAE